MNAAETQLLVRVAAKLDPNDPDVSELVRLANRLLEAPGGSQTSPKAFDNAHESIPVFKRYKDTIHEGELLPTGEMSVDGRVYDSPSAAAVAITGYPVNGWRFWKYHVPDGGTAIIDGLRLTRYQFQSGTSLFQPPAEADDMWEESKGVRSHESAPIDDRVQVHFDYIGFRTLGRYDVRQHTVEITAPPPSAEQLRGETGAPSTMASRIVRALNPAIGKDNRNGNSDWKETTTGRTVGELQRESHTRNTI